jgi:hypothetical protein
MAFSQADFDSWYNSQNEATRTLVSYADYQCYALHGSTPPYGAFPARSVDHIRHNSILRVQILILPGTYLGHLDLDPLQCQTMQGFVHTLQTAARDRGLWIHPDRGQEEEGELPVFLQGVVVYLDHHAVIRSRRFDEANQLVIEIEDQSNILYDFLWKLNFEYGRKDVLLGRVEIPE